MAQGASPAVVGLLLLLARCAALAQQPGMSVPVTVSKPDGAGPFPAIVLMHDCSGLGPRSSGTPGLWARTLVERGYVVIMPDSFSTRGFPDGVCIHAPRGRQNVSPSRRVEDAFEALAYAQKLPYVDGGRVGIMGGSHGGSTTLLALGQGSGGFRAGVALYPRCSFAAQSYAPSAPLMILTGELDDWTPAAECRRLEGGPTLLKIYPGAHHSFDNERPVRFVPERINPSSPSGRGATTGGNAAAWRDAIEQVTAFFARM